MKYFYIIICSIVTLLFISKGCNTIENDIIDSTTVINDTIIKTYVLKDTIIQYDSIIYISDTIINNDTIGINSYVYHIDDSLVSGTITAKGIFDPNLNYDLAFKSFHTTKHAREVKKNFRGVLYGGEITVEPLLSSLELNLAYQFKRGDIVKLGLGYNLNTSNKIITVGFLKRF